MNEPRVTAIIQARMQSTRLPGKVLKPLAGKPLIAHVISRSKEITPLHRVVLAVPDDTENRPLLALADTMEIESFAGSNQDVLARFYMAAEKFGGDYIVRITGDNPFTDPGYAGNTLRTAIEHNAHRSTLDGLPLGTAVEVISFDALQQAYRESSQPYHREHVSPYIKEHPEKFSIVHTPSGFHSPFPDLRLTVDTPEDFALAAVLYENLYDGSIFSLESVITFLQKNPAYLDINSGITQRPMTSWEGDDA